MRRLTRHSIRHRLLLLALLPAALLAILITTLVLFHGNRALDEALRERGHAIVSFLAPAAEYGVISGNRASLQTLIDAAVAQREVAAVAIYDDQGALLASRGRFNVLGVEALRTITGQVVSYPTRESFAVSAPVRASAVPIDDAFRFGHLVPDAPNLAPNVGWVYVELDKRPLMREKTFIVGATLGLVLIGLALTWVLGRRLARSISRPIARLVEGVEKMAGGALDVELDENASTAELARLQRGFNIMARSISESHRTLQSRIEAATAQLAHQAQHDPLTGLPNRRMFEERLEESIAASRRAGDHGALCFIDLDRFKIVNDTCGHAAGDDLLCRIARLIRQRVREQDIVCRVGGDEFALILRGCSRADALRIAEHLREGVAAFRFSWGERRFSIGASIGVAYIDGNHTTMADILLAADTACYDAKKTGRNRVVEYVRRHEPAGADAEGGAGKPREARGERIELHAQAIVPLDRTPAGGWLEVLLRVRDAHGELQFPGEYLARSESEDGGLDVDVEIAELACAALAQLQTAAPSSGTTNVSVNIGRASVLRADTFVDRLRASLQTNGVAPRQLVLELAVQLVEQFPDECRHLAERIRALGCRLALQQLDGSGIRHVKSLQPDYVKISLKSLIAAYGLEAGCNLAQGLAGMAAALGVTTVASEVEDPVLLETLHAFGFTLAQGHAIAAPQPIDEWRNPQAAHVAGLAS